MIKAGNNYYMIGLGMKTKRIVILVCALISISYTTYPQPFTSGLVNGFRTGLVPFVGQASLGFGLLLNKIAPLIFGANEITKDSVANGMLLGHTAGIVAYATTLALIKKKFGTRCCILASLGIPAVVLATGSTSEL